VVEQTALSGSHVKKPDSRRHRTAPPDGASLDSGIAALARAASHSLDAVVGDQQAEIAALKAAARRAQAAFDSIAEGVCFFDADWRLISCNRRYAEIYLLSPEDLPAGMTLRAIAELRAAVGTCAMPVDEYLALCEQINSGSTPQTWTAVLKDGRAIEIIHTPMPDGGWVSIHEDLAEARQTDADAQISLQTLIDWVPDSLWVKDVESRFVVANRATAIRTGKTEPEELIGKSDLELCPPETAREYLADEQRVLTTGKPMIDKEEYVVGTLGKKTWILTTKVPLRNDKDEIFGLVGVSRDITERRQADLLRDGQAHLLEEIASGAALETVLEHLVRLIESQLAGITATIVLLDDDGVHLRHGAAPTMASDFARAMDSIPVGEKAASSGTAVFRKEPVIVADIAEDPLWQGHRDLVAGYGFRSCWSNPIISQQGKALGALTLYSHSAREPTQGETRLLNVATRIATIALERKLAEDRINFMANHDALTGLPNRVLLKDRLAQALLYAQRYKHWATVVFVDLDGFKLINDTLGHNVGDELLKEVARRMVGRVRSIDTVVRIGGDEFVVLLFDQPKALDAVSSVVEKIQSAVTEPYQIGGRELRVTCSIGVANYPDDGGDADTLLANADAAMYRAKETGRDNFQFFTPELNVRAREELVLREGLRDAIARQEFVLHYQPQIDLPRRNIFAVEALLRWDHPKLGLVPPAKFIPMAEQSGLIVQIGDFVLHEACRQNKAWQDAGLPPLTMCVNVSARQFEERIFVDRVASALQNSGLEAKYLELELTESLLMQDVDHAVATMAELQDIGVQLSIDDFGTGYSSLSALKSFPVARLKIDRTFIKDLPFNAHDRAVTTAVISLGKKLNLRVIAEGVETEDQIEFLRDNDCDELQGFHFSKPLPAVDFEKLLGEHGKN
jgi:diguanylate cyclase (GGDEF)-like protein/PAS domain S-box-containing protein